MANRRHFLARTFRCGSRLRSFVSFTLQPGGGIGSRFCFLLFHLLSRYRLCPNFRPHRPFPDRWICRLSVWCGPALRTALRPPRRASFLRYGNLLFCGFVIPFAAFRLCFCLNEAQEGYRIARKTTMHCQSMCCCGLCRPDGCGATVAGVEFFHEFCVQGVWSGPMPASIPCRSQCRGGRNPGPGRCAARNAFRWVAAGLASSPALLKG